MITNYFDLTYFVIFESFFVILHFTLLNQYFLINFCHSLNLQIFPLVYLFSKDPGFVFLILLLDYSIQNFHFVSLNPIIFASKQIQPFKMLGYFIYLKDLSFLLQATYFSTLTLIILYFIFKSLHPPTHHHLSPKEVDRTKYQGVVNQLDLDPQLKT